MTDPQNPKVWPVFVTFSTQVRVYVEADTIPDAQRIAERSAMDMDVVDAVGSDFDDIVVKVAPEPTNLAAVAALDEEAYVWRDGKDWPLADEAYVRLEELKGRD